MADLRRPVDLALRDLRKYASKTQIEAAQLAETTQSELSRLERRDDFRLSTLRRYVAALGGELELVVSFGSSSFRLVGGEPDRAAPGRGEVTAAIDGLAGLGDWLPPLVAGRSKAELTARRADCGAFSLTEHVWHLHDLEIEAYGERLRRTLAEDAPRLPDFEGDRLAAQRAYQDKPIAPALRALVGARRLHVTRLRRLGEAALGRIADLDGVGPLPLAALIIRWRSHDMGHRLEMERLAANL